VDLANDQFKTPLFKAAESGRLEILKVLVKAGAEVRPSINIASQSHHNSQALRPSINIASQSHHSHSRSRNIKAPSLCCPRLTERPVVNPFSNQHFLFIVHAG
jgi:hypothetical protein